MKSDKIILHLQPAGSQPSPRVKLAAKTTIQGTPPYFLLFILSLRLNVEIMVSFFPQCCVSVIFRYGSGFCYFRRFVIDLQDANKNFFFLILQDANKIFFIVICFSAYYCLNVHLHQFFKYKTL
jgi:hypothetical protein